MKVVIDTNVARTANGDATHATAACQLDCVDFLAQLVRDKNRVVTLDSLGLIIEEYAKGLSRSGGPGTGHMYFKHVHDHQGGDRVCLVDISVLDDENRGFEELPENSLDADDRKFLAVALIANAELVNAVDSDYQENICLITELGIALRELCPEHVCLDPAKG